MGVESVRQSESECGPRMIMGMVSICQATTRSGSTIEEAIAISSGSNGTSGRSRFDSDTVRRATGEWMEMSVRTKEKFDQQEATFRKFLSIRRRQARNSSRSDKENTNQEVISLDISD